MKSIGGGGVEAIAYGSVSLTPFLISAIEEYMNPVILIGIVSLILLGFGVFLSETLNEPV